MQNGINKIFDLFDDDHTGSVNSNNIRRVAKELGETMNIQELEEMLQRAASNGRGNLQRGFLQHHDQEDLLIHSFIISIHKLHRIL